MAEFETTVVHVVDLDHFKLKDEKPSPVSKTNPVKIEAPRPEAKSKDGAYKDVKFEVQQGQMVDGQSAEAQVVPVQTGEGAVTQTSSEQISTLPDTGIETHTADISLSLMIAGILAMMYKYCEKICLSEWKVR